MKKLFLGIALVFLGFFLIYPLVWLLPQSFIANGRFTLKVFTSVLSSSLVHRCLVNSFVLAGATLVGTSVIGISLAIVLTRYRLPGAMFYRVVFILPMIVSPFVGAIGMQQILARFGSLNLLLLRLKLISGAIPWMGSGLLGIAILQTLHLYPIMYLNISAALSNFDRASEEAAASLGACSWETFWTITFPLLRPAYFAACAIIFIWSLTDLGTPLVFEFKYLLPVQIFNAVSDINVNPAGYSLVVIILLISAILFWLTRRMVERSPYTTGRTPINNQLTSFSRKATVAVSLGLIFLAGVSLLPHLSIILNSFSERWFFSVLPSRYSTRFYTAVFRHPLTKTGLVNSLVYSGLATLVDISLGLIIGYLLARWKFRGRLLLDTLAMIPLAIPGIALAFAYCTAFSGTFLDPRNNPAILLVAIYSVRRLPFLVRTIFASFQQLNENTEEVSASLGAKPATTFRRIVLPQIAPGVMAGGIMVFAFSMMEVSSGLVLAFRQRHFPISKVIYTLAGRLTDGPNLASALAVLGTLLLAACLMVATRLARRHFREFFSTV
ncbi:MAG: iron ABC transporter permease [Candidatus Omnitrophica bacterium]|nr:iron ABC transporter permease [Candidatus Omnitrophota bacterium]